MRRPGGGIACGAEQGGYGVRQGADDHYHLQDSDK